jgi:hypothetical protein
MIDAKITLTTVEGENRQFVAQSGSGHAVVIDDKQGNTGPKPLKVFLCNPPPFMVYCPF